MLSLTDLDLDFYKRELEALNDASAGSEHCIDEFEEGEFLILLQGFINHVHHISLDIDQGHIPLDLADQIAGLHGQFRAYIYNAFITGTPPNNVANEKIEEYFKISQHCDEYMDFVTKCEIIADYHSPDTLAQTEIPNRRIVIVQPDGNLKSGCIWDMLNLISANSNSRPANNDKLQHLPPYPRKTP